MSILIKPAYAMLAILVLSSCSPKHTPSSGLPDYSDMGAAADAGKTPSPTLNNKSSY